MPWKIGAFLSLSGAETVFGTDTKDGIDLALAEVNARGGIHHRPVEITYVDDRGSIQATTEAVQDLIARGKVVALLGEVASSRSKAGGIVAQAHGIPMVATGATHPAVTTVGPFVFRTAFTDEVQATAAAEHMAASVPSARVALVSQSDDLWSQVLAEQFRKDAPRLGLQIVADETFSKTTTDFTAALRKVDAARAAFIYAPVYFPSMVPIAKQSRTLGLRPSAFFGADGWDATTLLDEVGDLLEGARLTNHWAGHPSWPGGAAFEKSFRARYGRLPWSISALGYDAAAMLFDAMERADGETPDAIRRALDRTETFEGATGPIFMAPTRNPEKPVVIVRIQDRQFRFESRLLPRHVPGRSDGGGQGARDAVAEYQRSHASFDPDSPPPAGIVTVLNRGSYLSACGVPASTEVNVMTAVQEGRARGVTVWTNPADDTLSGCVADGVRSMPFGPTPDMFLARTRFVVQP